MLHSTDLSHTMRPCPPVNTSAPLEGMVGPVYSSKYSHVSWPNPNIYVGEIHVFPLASNGKSTIAIIRPLLNIVNHF